MGAGCVPVCGFCSRAMHMAVPVLQLCLLHLGGPQAPLSLGMCILSHSLLTKLCTWYGLKKLLFCSISFGHSQATWEHCHNLGMGMGTAVL